MGVTKMLQRWLRDRGREAVERGTTEQIEDINYPILMVPFHGHPVPVMVRELTQAQIVACGSFSLIETFKDRIHKQQMQASGKQDMLEMVEYAEKQHEVCRRALMKPTYEQIIETLTDNTVERMKSEVKRIEENLKDIPRGEQRDELERELDSLRVWTDLILPDDFTATITAYALGVDKSDIKELSEEALFNAAVLAEHGHDNPADHIEGKFTAWMRDDINNRAWLIWHEKRKDQRGSKNGR